VLGVTAARQRTRLWPSAERLVLDAKLAVWQVVAAMFKQMGKFEGPATVWHLPPDERRAFMNRVRH